MALDPLISLNAKAPDSMSNLSSLLNMGQQALALKKAKATYGADVESAQAGSETARAQANIATANVQPLIAQQQAETQSSQTGAKNAQWDLNSKIHQVGIQGIASIATDPRVQAGDPQGINDAINEASQRAILAGANPDDVAKTVAPFQQLAKTNPKGVQQMALGALRQGLGLGQQAQAIQPGGIGIDNGQQSGVVSTNPLAGIPNGALVPGTGVQKQIPVGTQVFNPNTNAPALTGPGGGAGPQAGPALGAPEAAAGAVKPVSEDWQATIAQAAKAAQNIGVLQNIKQHAEGAAVGVGAERRSLINGIAGLVGLDPGEMAKTDTDLLAKNSNMLALAGGNTDFAKSLAELANPNIHMTKEAITQAADQIIGQQKITLAKQQFLQPYAGNPQDYTQKLAQFNKVADPRAFEFASKDPAERAAMLKRMSPADKADFKQKLEALHQLGISP